MAGLPTHPNDAVKKRNPNLFPAVVVNNKMTFGELLIANATPETSILLTNLAVAKSTDEEKLNKLEKAWLSQLRLTYPADRIGIQSITLKLGDDCRYTPDLWTIDANGQIEFWETKGFMRDDAQVKIKIAARTFRWARFTLVTKIKGQWIETKVKP